MDSQFLSPGTILRDTYRIERVLGRGGFGITYLATDITLERPVAIKEFFPKEYCDRQDSTSDVTLGSSGAKELVTMLKAKFLKEARNIAKFGHPGIIKIYSAFEANNTAYYAMEFIDGYSLAEGVRKFGMMDADRAVDIIRKVGNALDYVHARRINHLDVKPGNIMWNTETNEPILIDFGLSKQYDSQGLQTSSTPAGVSHGYAPVEQYKDGGVREFAPQTDVYSLGATLYYLVSGVRPPEAMSLIDEDLGFPAGFPEELKMPVARAMQPRRAHRYPSVSAFTEALANAESDDLAPVPVDFDDDKTKASDYEKTNLSVNKANTRPRKPDPEIGIVPDKKSRSQSLYNNVASAQTGTTPTEDDNWKDCKPLDLVSIDVKKLNLFWTIFIWGITVVGTLFVLFSLRNVFIIVGGGCILCRIGYLMFRLSENYPKLKALCQWYDNTSPKGAVTIFATANKKFGLFNATTFKILIEPQYDRMEWYKLNKILKVQKGNDIFYINLKNKKVTV